MQLPQLLCQLEFAGNVSHFFIFLFFVFVFIFVLVCLFGFLSNLSLVRLVVPHFHLVLNNVPSFMPPCMHSLHTPIKFIVSYRTLIELFYCFFLLLHSISVTNDNQLRLFLFTYSFFAVAYTFFFLDWNSEVDI